MDNAILFFAFAAIALAGAVGVVVARNPVHSALFLVLTMITMAGLFLMLDAPMVAIVQVIVYASAIVVLFLFVIMLLGVDREEDPEQGTHRFQRPVAAVLGLAVLLSIVGLTGAKWDLGNEATRTASGVSISASRPSAVVATAQKSGEIDAESQVDHVRPLARTLFTRFAWPFEVTAVLLVVAVVGAVVLARRSRRPEREEARA